MRRRTTVLALSTAVLACSPSPTVERRHLASCGEDGPVELIRVERGSALSWQLLGDKLLVEAQRRGRPDGSIATARSWIVESCGESTVALSPWTSSAFHEGAFDVVGGWLLRCGSSQKIDVSAIDEPFVAHRLLEASVGCEVYPLGDGFAAIDPNTNDLLYAHPEHPDEPPVVLSRNVFSGGAVCARDDFVRCWVASNIARVVSFGDHLLVPHTENDPPPGIPAQPLSVVNAESLEEAQFASAHRLRSIRPIEDSDYAVLIATLGGGPVDSEILVYDGVGRTTTRHGDAAGFGTAGMWLDPQINTVYARTADLVHIVTGDGYRVGPADHWDLLPSTDGTILLRIRKPGDTTPPVVSYYAEHVETGIRRLLVELDNPRLEHIWIDRVSELIFVAEDRTVRGWDGGAPVKAEPVPAETFVRTPSMTFLRFEDLPAVTKPIVFVDRDNGTAWELTFPAKYRVAQERDGVMTIIYDNEDTTGHTLWRLDLPISR
ncbi:MAG: hypothetical protein JKY37_22030 [Nannocystaceae bacterium]|nr:hypothetical protein [Nannocystaceae bacterium]